MNTLAASRSYLFDEVDGWLEVETKVNEFPLDSLPLVFLLLKDEHLRGQEIITVVIIIVAYYVSDDMQNVFVKQHTAILRSSRLKIYSPCG